MRSYSMCRLCGGVTTGSVEVRRNSSWTARPQCHRVLLSPEHVLCFLLSQNKEELLVEYWDVTVTTKLNAALLHITLKALQTFCDYFFQHLNFLYCCFKLLTFGYLGIRGTAEQSVGAMKERSCSFSVDCLSCPLVLDCFPACSSWGYPLTSAHINLAKYRGYYCNVRRAAPLVLLSHLSVGWMKARLLGKQPLSFPLQMNLRGDFIH